MRSPKKRRRRLPNKELALLTCPALGFGLKHLFKYFKNQSNNYFLKPSFSYEEPSQNWEDLQKTMKLNKKYNFSREYMNKHDTIGHSKKGSPNQR